MSSPPPIFINYRREDSEAVANSLLRALQEKFGAESTFLDTSEIEVGATWPDTIRSALEDATVVLAVIGPKWLAAADQYSRRRIDGEHDWVRSELATALAADKSLLPVLLDGVEMPPAEALPVSIAGLAERNACRLRARDWDQDFAELCKAIQAELDRAEVERTDPIAIYRRHIREAHGSIVSLFGEDPHAFDDVFVELQIDCVGRDPRDPQTRSGPLRQLLADGFGSAPAGEPVRAWTVLGEPGAGKSTVARHLAWTLAGELDAPVPIYVSLAAYARRDAQHPFAAAESELVTTQPRAAGLRRRLEKLANDAEGGGVWLLLDGLDEVDPDLLRDLRPRLTELHNNYPGVRLAVLSRKIGHQPLAGFRTAQLRPLDPAKRGDLLKRWLGADASTEVATQLNARPQLAALAHNPLLLTIVAWLSREDAELPRTRIELYRRAIDLLLRRPFGSAARAMRAPMDSRTVLRGLALALQSFAGASWSKDDLGSALWQARETDPHVERAVSKTFGDNDKFLDELATCSGILAAHKGENDPWEFLHRQFREFLAAEALDQRVRDGASWQSAVGELTDESIPRFSETLGLFCGMENADAFEVLGALRDRDPAAAVRALDDVEGPAPCELLEFLWATPTDPEVYEPTWNGDDLRRLLRGWHLTVVERDRVREWLWARVVPVQDPNGLMRLAWLHLALAGLLGIGKVDHNAFFTRCKRPRIEVTGVEWVTVPAGGFSMGSPQDEKDRLESEGPQREVRVEAFGLAKTAVTNGQYGLFDPGERGPADHPVVEVSWWEAYLYSVWAGGRLPSEAEWEYACRAGTVTPFETGENLTTEQANYDGNHPYAGYPKGEYREQTVSVMAFEANGFGLLQMHGNVWEWCQDHLHDSYEGAPTDGSAWVEEGSGQRVLRGGSWPGHARRCRSAARVARPPGGRGVRGGLRPASSLGDFTTSPT